MEQTIFSPLEDYEKKLREIHKTNTEAFFEELVNRSGIDQMANKASVAAYNAQQEKADAEEKKAGRWKAMRLASIIGVVIAVITAIVCLIKGIALVGFCAALVGLALMLLWLLVLNPRIKNLNQILANEKKKAEQLLAICRQQMAPLNALMTGWDGVELIENVIPQLDFLPNFSSELEKDMLENYDFSENDNEDQTVIDTLSGRYNGNPFLFERRRVHKMGMETYHGYETITWSTWYTDSNGKRRRRINSQTLHATVTKPKPFYHLETYLHYGSEAGPDLSFSRLNKHLEDLSQRALDSLVRKGEKKLRKKAADALEKNKNFTGMTNTEFDVLFDALDRDHEVQFRLLFTPLAQTNMMDLLRSETGYGDDFDFFKQQRMSTIVSEHSQNRSLLLAPEKIHSHDFELIRQYFMEQHQEYFKAVYFDFAPLLAVPAYQDPPVHSLNPLPDLAQRYSTWEHEALANSLDSRLLAHPHTETPLIIKTAYMGRNGQAEEVRVTTHSYNTVDRVDVVAVSGGDGRIHMVRVPWQEYIPLQTSEVMSITTEKPEEPSVHTHGLYARVRKE